MYRLPPLSSNASHFKWCQISFITFKWSPCGHCAKDSSSLAPAVMGGQTVTRWWRVLSRKQREESPWSCSQRWSRPSTITTWSCVWTPTPGTPGSLSSGSTASSAASRATHRRTRTTRKCAPVGDNKKKQYALLFYLAVTEGNNETFVSFSLFSFPNILSLCSQKVIMVIRVFGLLIPFK